MFCLMLLFYLFFYSFVLLSYHNKNLVTALFTFTSHLQPNLCFLSFVEVIFFFFLVITIIITQLMSFWFQDSRYLSLNLISILYMSHPWFFILPNFECVFLFFGELCLVFFWHRLQKLCCLNLCLTSNIMT